MTKTDFDRDCWEIDFPSDDADTRGISQELAERLLAESKIKIKFEGMYVNSYGERVNLRTYTPATPDDEQYVWDAYEEDE